MSLSFQPQSEGQSIEEIGGPGLLPALMRHRQIANMVRVIYGPQASPHTYDISVQLDSTFSAKTAAIIDRSINSDHTILSDCAASLNITVDISTRFPFIRGSKAIFDHGSSKGVQLLGIVQD